MIEKISPRAGLEVGTALCLILLTVAMGRFKYLRINVMMCKVGETGDEVAMFFKFQSLSNLLIYF